MTVLAAGSVFDPIYNVLGGVLAFFYSVIPDLGVGIILLTVSIMLVLYPLTAKQAKSMMAMQRLQPEIKKLQTKHKGDRQKISEETMKLYQEHKVNPLAGCLPLIVQLPIFFALFQVLRDAYKHIPKSSDLYQALCNGLGNLCGDELTTKLLDQRPRLGRTFTKGDSLIHHLEFLGIDLQKSATDPHGGFFNAAPYFVLIGLVMLTGYLQTRQAQKRTPQVNKQMGAVMKVLPVFFGVISISFPAGLVLYFFVSNLFRLGQQEVIFRRFGTALSPGGKQAIDVASKERPRRGAPRELANTDGDEDDDEAIEAVVAPKPTPKQAEAKPTPPAAPSAGAGLRGLFKLPPPPDGQTSGTRPSGAAGRGPTRPPQPKRSNARKKRKR